MRHAVSLAKLAFYLIVGASLAYLLWAGSNLRMEPNPNISGADFVAIILTALGVILAALAIFLGGMALVGWKTFDDRVRTHAEEFLEKRFSPSDQRYADLVETLRDDARREAQLAKNAKKDIENQSPFDENEV
ncbi:hypothetical protein [Pseudopontixanthobacter vadosimaris]|uniref:hypothetical protein n=1 Tax=Pseudopontixanthobacter vadosimaris TaxID=2726450 RepID=UPI001473312C|nr:hypothetical protein [Pseudopontixanthobacter vadosimaris]